MSPAKEKTSAAQQIHLERGLPIIMMANRDQEASAPESLRLDGKRISTSTPSTTLYTLNHNILDRTSRRTAPVSLYSLAQGPLGPKRPLYNLTYGPPDPDSRPECYLAANDRAGGIVGNIALLQQAPTKSASGARRRTQLHATLSPGRFWYHQAKFAAKPWPLLVMKKTAGGCDFYNEQALPIAREKSLKHGERQLRVLVTLDQQQRDTLVAVWCLGLWRKTSQIRARRRAKTLRREKKAIKRWNSRGMEKPRFRPEVKKVLVKASGPEISVSAELENALPRMERGCKAEIL